MKIIIFTFLLLVFLFSFVLIGSQNQEEVLDVKNLEIQPFWQTNSVLQVPESVIYDPARACLYVSNIAGRSDEKDKNGFLSKLDLQGNILELKWIEGLNAPKGMVIFQDFLFVTDLDRIIKIDLDHGKIQLVIDVPGAIFLNDLEADDKGTLYISDMRKSVIYRIRDDEPELWLQGEQVDTVNGLFLVGDILYFGNSGDGMIKAVDVESAKIRNIVEVGRGIDGLKMIDAQTFLTSDWQGHTLVINIEGEKKELLDTTDQKINAADLEYIPDKHMILIPTFFDNRVMAYKIKSGNEEE